MGEILVGALVKVLIPCVVIFAILGVILYIIMCAEERKMKGMSLDQQIAYANEQLHGPLNEEIKCPHCRRRGGVHTRQAERKTGVSGSKLTGAILTGGTSLLVTGLSRREQATNAYCDRCESKWRF
jgi:hypothetical protein